MSSDKISKTLGVALGVCFFCSILVSAAAVGLKSIQEKNKKLDLLKNILIAGDLYKKGADILQIFKDKVDAELIELSSGNKVSEDQFDAMLNIENFNINTLAKNSEYGKDISAKKDIAGIKRMPKFMAVYKVKGDQGIEKYILPIYGKGLWSTMYGFIALNKDLRTIDGFTFYEHGETPGLGGEVDNPRWKAIWKGKQAYDENWELKIEVIKGQVDPGKSSAKYQVDGLSGSTITTRGINYLVKFWLGDEGYGTLMKKLREEA